MRRTKPFFHMALCLLLLTLVSVAPAERANAQSAGQTKSFIKPFPNEEFYRLRLIGDWFADGVRSAISEGLVNEPQVKTEKSVLTVRSLRRSSWDKTIDQVEASLSQTPVEIAVVMFGAAEFGSLSIPGRRRVRLRSDEWKQRYSKRVDRLMKALRQKNTAVYWLGVPILRREDHSDGAQIINEIFRERAYINGVKFVDTYTDFADEDGNYGAYGPDLIGKITRLRSRDGVYFTGAGYRKLAHFVTRIISRDVRKAISEREIPLAGSQLEQSRIRTAAVAKNARQSAPAINSRSPRRQTSQRIDSSASSAPSPLASAAGIKDQKADNSTIALRTVADGVARTEKIEIVRPAIPATVLALLTRRQSSQRAARMGDSVSVELPGGIMLLSSVTAVNAGATAGPKVGVSPTQSAFFKVWAKGERLQPVAGRADDIEWPRPEPQPVVRATYVPQPQGLSGKDRPARPPRKFTPEGFPPLPAPNPRNR